MEQVLDLGSRVLHRLRGVEVRKVQSHVRLVALIAVNTREGR